LDDLGGFDRRRDTIISIPSTAHSFIPGLKPFFSANHSHCTTFLFLCYQFRCLVNTGTMGVNSSPKTVIRQRRGCDLNPGPSASESCTLTTRLPSHPSCGQCLEKELILSSIEECSAQSSDHRYDLYGNGSPALINARFYLLREFF